MEQVSFSVEWKSEGAKADESGDNEDEELACVKRDESEGNCSSRERSVS